MKTPSLALSLFALSFGMGAAADATSAEKKDAKEAKPNIQVSGPTSHISSSLASTIQASLPKYQPPPPPPPPEPDEHVELASPDGATEGMEAEAVDQPKNKIIRLPRYVVEADRPPVFKESEIHTKSGLGKLAAARYLSSLDRNVLNRFTLPIIGITPEQRALMMYQEDERLQNISDINNSARSALLAGDKKESEALKKERNSAFIRSGGMDWTLPKDND